MATAACVSMRCVGARSFVAFNVGSCSAIVRRTRLSAPSSSIVANGLPAKNSSTKGLSVPRAYSALAIRPMIAAPPLLQ